MCLWTPKSNATGYSSARCSPQYYHMHTVKMPTSSYSKSCIASITAAVVLITFPLPDQTRKSCHAQCGWVTRCYNTLPNLMQDGVKQPSRHIKEYGATVTQARHGTTALQLLRDSRGTKKTPPPVTPSNPRPTPQRPILKNPTPHGTE
jgi:hypothetical protein